MLFATHSDLFTGINVDLIVIYFLHDYSCILFLYVLFKKKYA